MLLDDILGSSVQWTEQGLVCADVLTAAKFHKFLREAVLDRRIYLNKAIGAEVLMHTSGRKFPGVYISRHQQLGDSYPELMINLVDKVFLNTNKPYVETEVKCGLNTVDVNTFGDRRDLVVKTLYTNPTICRGLYENCYLRVHLAYDNGYRDMSQNSKAVEAKTFPFYTDYSLADYIRILPVKVKTNVVPWRLYNGLTLKDFRDILEQWNIHSKVRGLKEEDLLWLQSLERYRPMI